MNWSNYVFWVGCEWSWDCLGASLLSRTAQVLTKQPAPSFTELLSSPEQQILSASSGLPPINWMIHTHTVWVKTLMNLTIAGVQMDVHRPQIWYNRFWSIPNLEHHIAKLEATWPIEHPGVALACATVRVWISRKFAFVTSLLSYTLNRNTMLSQISKSIIIWVWVKIRYPNNWMVNTKLDIHICGPILVFHFDPHFWWFPGDRSVDVWRNCSLLRDHRENDGRASWGIPPGGVLKWTPSKFFKSLDHLSIESHDFYWFWGSPIEKKTLLRVIPTLANSFDQVSDILYIYISIYGIQVLPFCLAYIYSDILSDLLAGILSGIYSGILSGICHMFWHLSGILSDILSDIVSGILFGMCSELAFWSSGPGVTHCIRSCQRRRRKELHLCENLEALTWQVAKKILFFLSLFSDTKSSWTNQSHPHQWHARAVPRTLITLSTGSRQCGGRGVWRWSCWLQFFCVSKNGVSMCISTIKQPYMIERSE